MKISLSFVLLLSIISASQEKEDVVVTEESIVVAINEQNTEVIKQALSSFIIEDAVVSAFSSALQNGNLRPLAQIFYTIMSTNPPKSFIVNQMLRILQQIYFGVGMQLPSFLRCDQILQLLWEIDGLIESDEISEKLQVQFPGSFVIQNCLARSSQGATADSIVPDQDKCWKSRICPFFEQQTKFLLKDGVCAGMRVCDDIGLKERHECEKRC